MIGHNERTFWWCGMTTLLQRGGKVLDIKDDTNCWILNAHEHSIIAHSKTNHRTIKHTELQLRTITIYSREWY
jgi:hypothetical protein